MGLAHLLGIAAHGGLHGQGSIAGAHGVIFVRHRGAEERHDAVAEHLVDGAFIAMHGVHHGVQGRVQESARLFRIKVGDQLG